MPALKKISSFAIMLSCIAIGAYGKNKIKHTIPKHKHEMELSFRAGKSILFAPATLSNANTTKKHYLSTHSFVLSKPINSYFRIETGVNYNSLQKSNTGIGYKNSSAPYSIAIPVTIQYYFLPQKHRLKPFCGAGFQYQYNLNAIGTSSLSGDNKNFAQPQLPGTKYINILFTQGVTFEINTKIQISESIHFVPGTTDKMIGIDLGLGYKLP